ncbi:hypothetical protein Tsubulata_036692 [Turnera subulata]|uniref:Uncharacterized protein n=1 Tax=Turnera subulata TaxID=218843 RepID=A0A9Q0F815_9ROSI|nr:hypothetical protein Tsubulata_036692 [Turnera subulata]
MDVVLEYLKDAKEHGQNQGNDLLASVRVIGSYLAEAPDACKDKRIPADIPVIMMASSLSALIFDYTSHQALLNHPNFDSVSLGSLYGLIAKSLAAGRQAMSDVASSEMDLLEIVTSGISRWVSSYWRY